MRPPGSASWCAAGGRFDAPSWYLHGGAFRRGATRMDDFVELPLSSLTRLFWVVDYRLTPST